MLFGLFDFKNVVWGWSSVTIHLRNRIANREAIIWSSELMKRIMSGWLRRWTFLSETTNKRPKPLAASRPQPTPAPYWHTKISLWWRRNPLSISQEYVAPTRNTRSARKRAQSLTNHRAKLIFDKDRSMSDWAACGWGMQVESLCSEPWR